MIVIESRRGGRLAVTGGFFLMTAFLTLGVGVVGAFAALYVPVHEWGHWLCLRAQHIPVREVKLSAFGVQMRRGRAFASFRQQAVCALSGPLFPLPVGVLLWLLGTWEPVLRIGGAVFWGAEPFPFVAGMASRWRPGAVCASQRPVPSVCGRNDHPVAFVFIPVFADDAGILGTVGTKWQCVATTIVRVFTFVPPFPPGRIGRLHCRPKPGIINSKTTLVGQGKRENDRMINQQIERLLPLVTKPGRYVGGEMNSVVKEKREGLLRFAFCFPDTYEVGMSHLGMKILYSLFNERDDIWCERVFAPWVDMEDLMRQHKIPLYGLESGDPLRCFDFIGFTLQYELSYTNVLNMLDLGQIPLRSEDRGEQDPIVVAGGPCACNPEPLADFIDIFFLGEGEEVDLEVMDLYRACREEGVNRREFLRRASKVPGCYVPALYDVSYEESGVIHAVTPEEGAPAVVHKRVILDLDKPTTPRSLWCPFWISCTTGQWRKCSAAVFGVAGSVRPGLSTGRFSEKIVR